MIARKDAAVQNGERLGNKSELWRQIASAMP